MDDEEFHLILEEEEAGGALLPKGSTVRVTVPQGAPPFHYHAGALGVIPPGGSFVALVEAALPAVDGPAPAAPAMATAGAGSSRGTRQQQQQQAAAAAGAQEPATASYRVVAFGADSTLKANGQGLNSTNLATLALSALRTLTIPCAWAAEVELPNAEARMKEARKRLDVVKTLAADSRIGAAQGRQLLDLLAPPPKKPRSEGGGGGGEAGEGESAGTLQLDPTSGSALSRPPLGEALRLLPEEENEFGELRRKGGGGVRPSHLVVLQPDAVVEAAAAAAGIDLAVRVGEGSTVSSRALKTRQGVTCM